MLNRRFIAGLMGCLLTAGAAQAADDLPSLDTNDSVDAVSATVDTNPYSIILARNVFRLVPIPPPPEPPPTDVLKDYPAVEYVGWYDSGGKKKAMFQSVGKDAKDPENTKFFTLMEGEKQDNLELVGLDMAKEEANVLYVGIAKTLSIKSGRPPEKGKGAAAAAAGQAQAGMLPGIPPPPSVAQAQAIAQAQAQAKAQAQAAAAAAGGGPGGGVLVGGAPSAPAGVVTFGTGATPAGAARGQAPAPSGTPIIRTVRTLPQAQINPPPNYPAPK